MTPTRSQPQRNTGHLVGGQCHGERKAQKDEGGQLHQSCSPSRQSREGIGANGDAQQGDLHQQFGHTQSRVRKAMGTEKVTMRWGSPGRIATQATSRSA